MKRNTVYSLVVFLLVASYSLFGLLTQLLMGVAKWEGTLLFLGLTVFPGVVVGGIFYVAFTKIMEKFGSQENNSSPYVLNRNFVAASIALIAISSTYGVMRSYSLGTEQKAAAEKQREADERRKLAVAKAAEAERQRIASLTPEQRAAEEKQKREKVAAAAKEAARIKGEKAQALANEKKRDTQLQIAVGGAIFLKSAMKDPEAFALKSLLVMPDGTACYDYRAKNSFGAILPSRAVLSVSGTGKMLTQEHDGNAFVSVWNKNCTRDGGTNLAPLIEQKRLLD